MTEPAELLRVHDLEALAALVALGLRPVATEMVGTRVYFLLPATPAVQAVLLDHARDRLQFSPHTIIESYKLARRLLHDAQRRGQAADG